MTKARKYKLCGGTFFTLVLNARKQRMGVRDHYMGDKDGLSDPEVLLGLAKVMVPDFKTPDASMMPTVKTATSKYKSCIAGCGTYFPFEDAATIATFNNRVKTQYSSCLSAMCSFVSTFIDAGTSTKKDEYLIKALIEVIMSDNSIKLEQPLYIDKDGKTIAKSNLPEIQSFCLQSFLLGVFHYIIAEVKDNKVGAPTYNSWCPSQGNKPRAYTASLGENSSLIINLTYCDSIDSDTVDDEIVVETVVNDAPKDSQGAPTQQILNANPVFTTFNFNAPVGTVYGHVDQVVNNYGDKKDERK